MSASTARVSKWSVCTDELLLRRMGKSLEEIGELTAAIADHLLQAQGRCDDDDGESLAALTSEVADVLAQCRVTGDILKIEPDEVDVEDRRASSGRDGAALLALSHELGVLGSVAARVIIQGIYEIDPGTGLSNRARLQTALARTERAAQWVVIACGLDARAVEARAAHKIDLMREWEALYVTSPASCSSAPTIVAAAPGATDELLYESAVALVRETGKHSVSWVQRRLLLPWSVADSLVKRLVAESVIPSPPGT